MRVGSDGHLDATAPDPANLYDVVIVGGGPTGLYLGNQLHHYLSQSLLSDSPKLKILIVEKSASFSKLSKALAIHSRSLETLANLGPMANLPHALLYDPLPHPLDPTAPPTKGLIAQAAHIRDKTSVLAEFHPPAPGEIQSPYPAMLLRAQFDTEHLLAREILRRQQLGGDPRVALELKCSTEVVAIDNNDAYLRCPEYPVAVDLLHASGPLPSASDANPNKDNTSPPGSTTRTIHARYLIGCDGGRSPVRHMAHIDFPGTTRLEVMWMCDVRILTQDGRPVSFSPAAGPGSVSVMIGSKHGIMVVFPLQAGEGGTAPLHRIGFIGADEQAEHLFGSVDAAMEAGVADAGTGYVDKITGASGAASVPSQTPKLDVLEALFNARCKAPWADVLADPALIKPGDDAATGFKLVDSQWRTRFKLNERVAAAYVSPDRNDDPRIILAGDAAHVHTPVGGHGMNLGLQDAGNLALKLAGVLSGRVPSAKRAIESYVEERRPVAQQVVQMTSSNASFVSSHLALMRVGVGWVLPLVSAVVPSLLANPLGTTGNFGLEWVYRANGEPGRGVTWVDAKAGERVVKAAGGIRLQYPAGHRAPMRAALVPHPLKDIAIQVTPLDLYVDAGSRLSWTVLVLAPMHLLATVVFALPAEWMCDDDKQQPWAVVHRIALRSSPPETPHPLDTPQMLVVPGVQRKVTNAGAAPEFPQYDDQVIQQRDVPDKCRQWMDSDGSVARFLFGTTHHADFGCKKEGDAWVVVVRPDGYMGLCGFGVTGEQVGEYFRMCRG